MPADERDQASALEQALQGGASVSGELAGLVAVAKMVSSLPQPSIDMSFAAALEQRLLGAASAPAPQQAAVLHMQAYRARQHKRVRRSLVAAIAAAFMFAMPVAASANVGPANPMYPVRLAREEARVWGKCRIDQITCGFAHLDRANLRLEDLRLVVALGQTGYIKPTAARLRKDMRAGTRAVVAARPSATTLRQLQTRITRTGIELNKIAFAAPATHRNLIAIVIENGDMLSREVLVALGVDVSGVAPPLNPPLANGPTVAPPANQPPDEGGAQASPPKKRKRTPDRFGPGGTVPIAKPPPGETWQADDTVEDPCPLNAVAVADVSRACTSLPRSS